VEIVKPRVVDARRLIENGFKKGLRLLAEKGIFNGFQKLDM
jgi:hypothetical protein